RPPPWRRGPPRPGRGRRPPFRPRPAAGPPRPRSPGPHRSRSPCGAHESSVSVSWVAVQGTGDWSGIDVAYGLMIVFVLGVEDLADTRFALSPLHETLLSLRVLQDPGLSALHLPWRRSVLGRLGALDTGLLMSLVAQRRTLPDFLTPNPAGFAPSFDEELDMVRRTRPGQVRHDLRLAHAPDPLPAPLHDALGDDDRVCALRDAICEVLRQYWQVALEPMWPQM